MSDIVERLEKNCPCSSDIGCADALCREAAAEITRLRAELHELEAKNTASMTEIIRLRAENERLRDCLLGIGLPGNRIIYCRDGHEQAVLLARAALKENS